MQVMSACFVRLVRYLQCHSYYVEILMHFLDIKDYQK